MAAAVIGGCTTGAGWCTTGWTAGRGGAAPFPRRSCGGTNLSALRVCSAVGSILPKVSAADTDAMRPLRCS